MVEVVANVTSYSNIASGEGNDVFFTAANSDPYVPPVYVGDNFNITVGASLVLAEGESEGDYTIQSVSISGDTNVFTYTSGTTSATIEAGPSTPFNDFFEFLNLDKQLEVLEVDEARAQGFLALVQWSPPSQQSINKSHTVQVTYSNANGTITDTGSVILTGNVYFEYPQYTQLVKDLVDEGSL